MIEAIGSGQVRSIAKNRPVKRAGEKKGRPRRKEPPKESVDSEKEEGRLGAIIDERC